jgi:VanZ family protein
VGARSDSLGARSDRLSTFKNEQKFEKKKQMSAEKLSRVLFVLALLAIGVLALIPPKHLEMPLFDWWDKAQHALAFGVLTVWALLLWPASALRVVLGMLAYGAAIEVAQWAVGWRFGEWADWAADAVGVLSAWGACRAWTSSRA